MKQSCLSEADILCYFTNMPTPRMQKIVRAASKQGRVCVIYWKRSAMEFQSGLSDCAAEIPVAASFLNNRGLCRILAFLIFAWKSWRLLRGGKNARIVYVNYLDVLLIAAFAFRKRKAKFIYGIGDLSPAQYGGSPLVNKVMRRLEQTLMKRVSVLILSSPFFWSEYYAEIYRGEWRLIENMPPARTWEGFRRTPACGRWTVGFIGWIRDRKPIECLLAATAELRTQGRDVRVFFAGFGPDEERLRRHCAGRDDVTFSGPYQYNRDIQHLYEKVDIVFSVFDIDVANSKILMPNRFYEAIIAGLPIMVARDTMLADRVEKLGTGYVVDYLSQDDMKAAILSWIEQDAKAKCIAAALERIDQAAYFYDSYEPVLLEIFSIGGGRV